MKFYMNVTLLEATENSTFYFAIIGTHNMANALPSGVGAILEDT
jgi:hypothetical protein